MSTPEPTPTPSTDYLRDFWRGETTELCRALISHSNTLERHLRAILAAHAEYERDGEGQALAQAVRAAREEIK